MFDALAPADFAGLLAAVWDERDWTTDVQEREEEDDFLVAGDRGSGANVERGLILVRPGRDEEIGGQALQRFARLCEEKRVDVRVVATRGEFTEHAERVAAANDVHLLAPDALAATVREEGLEYLIEEYEADADAGDETGSGDGAGPLAALPLPGLPFAIPFGVPESLPGGIGRLVVGALLVVAVFGAGMAASGVLVQDGADETDDGFPVSALSTASANEAANVTVRWSAEVQPRIELPNATYEAPAGERFVVVRLAVTNRGSEPRAIRSQRFVLAANGTTHANQPLNGTRYFPPMRLDAGETRDVWTVFSVPEGATSGTLLVDQQVGSGPVAIRFVRDPALDEELSTVE